MDSVNRVNQQCNYWLWSVSKMNQHSSFM